MSASVFISHSSQDRKVATTLCAALESRGFSCWISSRDIGPGENFQVAIVRAIREAKMMLLVFTANSNTSEEMSKELALASQQKLVVVPLRIEDVAPNDAFAYEFATRQWIDFFADWETAIGQLCARLSQAMPADLPTQAAEPRAIGASPPPTADEPGPVQAERAPLHDPAAAAAPPARLRLPIGLLAALGVAAAVMISAVVFAPKISSMIVDPIVIAAKKAAARSVAPPSAAPVEASAAQSATPAPAPAPVAAKPAALASASPAAAQPDAGASADTAPPPVAAAPKPRHKAAAAIKADVPY